MRTRSGLAIDPENQPAAAATNLSNAAPKINGLLRASAYAAIASCSESWSTTSMSLPDRTNGVLSVRLAGPSPSKIVGEAAHCGLILPAQLQFVVAIER